MSIDNTDKIFAVKISALFIVLIISVLANKTSLNLKNSNRDNIDIGNKNSIQLEVISIKNTKSSMQINTSH